MHSVMAVLAALLLFAAGCGDGDDGDTAGGGGDAVDGPTIRIAPQNFAESVTLTEVYAQYLDARGYDVEVLDALGFREVVYPGIESGEIDMIVDYIGGALVQLDPAVAPSDDPDEVLGALEQPLADIGATALEATPAENRDAVLVSSDLADELGLETISDLVEHAGDLTFGSSSECVERPQCLPALADTYGIQFGDTVTLDYGPPLADGLRAGELDVIFYQTTAPAIEEDDLVVLEDDEGIFAAQNIAPIVREEILGEYDDDLVDALNELTAEITTDDLIAWNVRTDVDFDDSADVATDWLEEKDLL